MTTQRMDSASAVPFTPFLKVVADDLCSRFGSDLSKVTIIAPNKRARLFFKQYLSSHITDRPIWSPRFVTIGELFQEFSSLRLADPIQQICTLYEAYTKVSHSDETLDKFYSWADLMKNDFEDIDNNLANAEMLFANIKDLESMKDFSFLSPQQQEAIRHYFESFNASPDSNLKKRFLAVWNWLYPTYTEYRRLLRSKGMAYSGMMKRDVVESGNLHFDGEVYAVVGFNVLNATEMRLFKTIRTQCPDTLFYWDYDHSYRDFEAGRFIRDNIEVLGNALPSSSPHYDCLRHKSQLRFIASPTENAQTRYVSTWIDKRIADHPQTESAIVLCNESILQPVLHSIPDKIGDEPTELNVTMGYPLSDTPIFSFISALINLQTRGLMPNGRWRYTYVAAILKHPYTRTIIGNRTHDILAYLNSHNAKYPYTYQVTDIIESHDDEGQLIVHPEGERETVEFLADIFVPQYSNISLLDYLIHFTRQLGKHYKNIHQDDFQQQLYAESIFTTYSILNRLHTITEREPVFNVTNLTLSRLIIQMLRQQAIPFHGEPAHGLQIMGILETRNLDFRNVLLLSCGEGQFPKNDRMPSLIPYSLREAYGMTTIEKQISLYAYNFYNLLQRADNVTVMYNSTPNGPARGEMSRFMMQLMVEAQHIFGTTDIIDLRSLTSSSFGTMRTSVEVQKTPDVMQRLNDVSYISPSAINTYLDCPLKFYFQHVARLYIDDEISEDVDNRLFGNIFHKAMELLYKGFIGRWVDAKTMNDLARNSHAIHAAVDAAFAIELFKEHEEEGRTYHPEYNGEQLLNRHVIIKYIVNQLHYDAQLCPMRIIGLEQKKYVDLTFTDSQTGLKRSISVGGTIDRLEEATDGNGQHFIRIVDYKTSAKAQTAKDYSELFDPEHKHRPYHLLQALYYCEVLDEKEHPSMPIVPMLMYIKLPADKRQDSISIGSDNAIHNYVCQSKGDFTPLLSDLLSEIFLRPGGFAQREQKTCSNCKFKTFCKVYT